MLSSESLHAASEKVAMVELSVGRRKSEEDKRRRIIMMFLLIGITIVT